MKTKITKVVALFTTLAIIFSCTEDMEYRDTAVSPVNQLYEPISGKSVELVASATASLFFEWEAAKAEDSGSPLYEIVFDKEGGNFSNPLYKVLSDNNGARNYATISHKTLNKIGAAAGLNSGETGTIIWTVIASRGLSTAMSNVSHKLTITRMLGFAEVPSQLFLTGEATEGGSDISQAVPCSSPEQETFEIFTRLKGGKSYKLVDKTNDNANYFYIDGNRIVEGEGETTVEKDGIYRITMDFSIASVSIQEVKSVGVFFCPSNKVIFELSYKGNGIFEGEGKVTFKQESWGKDQRYKLLMSYSDKDMYWGTLNDVDSSPNGAGQEDSYYFIKEYGINEGNEPQWNHKWKFDNQFDGSMTKVTVKFNGANYTHFVSLGDGVSPEEPETTPKNLFLTGEASEGGNDISKAVQYNKLGEGIFEIFTRLQGGKTYKMASSQEADAKFFYLEDGEIKSGDGITTVEKDGIYSVKVDFSNKSVITKEIKSMGLWHCWDRNVLLDLPYIGNGVFEGTGTISPSNNDNRYKLLMVYADDSELIWGTKNDTDVVPGANPDPSYFYIMETNDNAEAGQWDRKWKFNDGIIGNNTKVRFIFTGENYTHSIEPVN